MSKPILVVRFYYDNVDILTEYVEKLSKNLDSLKDDYHILFIPDRTIDSDRNVELECYNSPHTTLEWENLQNKLLDVVNTNLDSEKKKITTKIVNQIKEGTTKGNIKNTDGKRRMASPPPTPKPKKGNLKTGGIF